MPVAAILLVGITFGVVLLRLQSPEPFHEPLPTKAIARRAAARPAEPPPSASAPAPSLRWPPRPRQRSSPPVHGSRGIARRALSASSASPTPAASSRGSAPPDPSKRRPTRRSRRGGSTRRLRAWKNCAGLWPDRAGLWPGSIASPPSGRRIRISRICSGPSPGTETLNQPLEALRLLGGGRPNPRYARRFEETRQRLETQFVQLDSRPPGLLLGIDGIPLYEKGKAGTVHLRIADDFGVKATEAWARSEGGPYVRVAIHHLFGSGYSLDVPPEVHRNQAEVEFYVVASDLSGHSGQLGSPERPLKMMRKSWLERLLGMNERKVG